MNRARYLDKINKTVHALGVAGPVVPTYPIGYLLMPRDYIALGVFGAGNPAAPLSYVDSYRLQAADGYEVSYTGPLLTQAHADVLMATLALASGASEGRVRMRLCDLERMLGRSAGEYNRDGLRRALRALTATCVQVIEPDARRRFSGSLLPWSLEERVDGETFLEVQIGLELVEFLVRGVRTVDLDARKRLARQPLAQWLQLYLQEAPPRVDLGELQRLSRSVGVARDFRRRASEACEALLEARAGVGGWAVGWQGEALVRVA